MNPPDEAPEHLLTEEGQWTAPWGGSEDGAPCDKSQASGRTRYECWSCLLAGTDPGCPACAGRVRWEDRCPVCRGTGRIDGKPRRGVSVYPRVEGLYHYLLATEADLNGVLVELEAERVEDLDFDADQGALLVIPRKVTSAEPIDAQAVEAVREPSRERAVG